ncbi:hypothetical protein FS837_012191 [Tulasnella sp. UAMH 9824]|nr:hypothetical protein FS837_012191 [Tulasnella sp. UAMH 9824]
MVTTVQRRPRPPQEPPSSLSKWHDPKKMRQRGGIFRPTAENPLIGLLLAIPNRAGEPRSTRKTPRSKTPRRRAGAGSGDKGAGAAAANYQPPSSPLLNKSARGKARKSKASLSRRKTRGEEDVNLADVTNDATLDAGRVGVQSEAETDNEPLGRSTRRTPGRKQAQPPLSDDDQPIAPLNPVRRRSSKKFKELAPETSDPPIPLADLQSSVRSRKQLQLSPIVESPLASPAPPPLKNGRTKPSATAGRNNGTADPVTKPKAPAKRKKQEDEEDEDLDLGSPLKRPRIDTVGVRQTPSRAAKQKQVPQQQDSPPPPKSTKAKPTTTASKSRTSAPKSTSAGKMASAFFAEQDDSDVEVPAPAPPRAKAKPGSKKDVRSQGKALEAGRDDEHEVDDVPLGTESPVAPAKTSSKRKKLDDEGDIGASEKAAAASKPTTNQPSAKALGKRKAEETISPDDENDVQASKPKDKKTASKQPKRPKNPAPATKRKPQAQKGAGRKKRKIEPETDEEDERDFVDVVVKTKTGDDESSADEGKGRKGKKTGGSKSKGKAKSASAKRKPPAPRPSMFVKAEAAYLDSEADPMDLLR